MESIYKGMEPEQYDELLSNFLVTSWSYSKVTGFARNEKAFEMQHIYGLYSRSSASTFAGNAYHAALDYYFAQKKEGKQIDLVEMEQAAFAYLDGIDANKWKIQKTTPTIETCRLEAIKAVTALLKNFYTERALYEEDLAEVLFVELYGDEFVTVNAVDIPLPLHFKMDLGIKLKDGRTVLIDHKSKKAYTPENEIALSIGIQAITYVIGYETKTGQTVDEVWFVENKISQNKDKSPQLVKLPVEITPNTRRLYEALLYEPLKRMVEAVSNPDYIYLINDADNYVDMAELYDFWARTMISEVGVEEFNVEESKKELVAKRLKKIRDSSLQVVSPAVIRKFKENASKFIQYDMSNKDMTPQEKIEHVLRTFGVVARVAHTFEGYSSNTYLLEVSAGVMVSSIYKYRLDVANALNVPTVRFSKEMKVYEGKSYLAVECSKKIEGFLPFNKEDRKDRQIPLGKDNFGNVIYWDLDNHSTPHALICGQTGSGKSVCVDNIIEYAKDVVEQVVILDPKYEFVKKAAKNIVVENEISAIEETMRRLVEYMNELVRTGKKEMILVIFDEFADAFANARSGKALSQYAFEQVGNYADGTPKMQKVQIGTAPSLEENLRLLVQKGRSCGIRVVAATQRASTKVITGDAKANFPVQICFRLQKEVDSRVVLDEPGAEALAGKGDGLIKSPQYNDIVRFQAYYKP